MDDIYVNRTQPETVTAQPATEQHLPEEKKSSRTSPTDGTFSQSAITKQPQPDFWQPPTAATQPQSQYPTAIEAQYYWYPPQQDYYPTQYQQYTQPQQQQQQTVVVVNSQTSRNGQQQNVDVWSSGLCGCLEDTNSCKKSSVFRRKVTYRLSSLDLISKAMKLFTEKTSRWKRFCSRTDETNSLSIVK